MKRMKQLAGLLLALTMVFALTVPAMAAGETGSITINGASTENNYLIYKMLVLESYDTAGDRYSYYVNEESGSNWLVFFEDPANASLIEVNEVTKTIDGVEVTRHYITWKSNDRTDATVAAFAKRALAFAEANHIDPDKSSAVPEDRAWEGTTLKFTDLPLGYYLVDSTMGALCGLTTTNPNASLNAKNAAPTISKQVQEDSTNQWDKSNTAEFGQVVQFRVTIDVQKGAQNYVLHDKMSTGFTFTHTVETNTKISTATDFSTYAETNRGVLSIEHTKPGTGDTHAVPTEAYTLKKTDCDDTCTFEIIFDETKFANLESNDKIVVYYNAVLNENAIINGDGNVNTAYLSFGDENEEHKTTASETCTKVFSFDIVKTNNQNALLDGAAFRVYDAEENGNEIKVIAVMDGGSPKVEDGRTVYRRAMPDEDGVPIAVIAGQARILGFDNGTYFVEETQVPVGCNPLEGRQKFIISDSNLDSIFNGGVYSTGSGVHVVNNTGTMLAGTGGMGTVLFVTFGMLVVLGTGVLLVTKKRMAMIED